MTDLRCLRLLVAGFVWVGVIGGSSAWAVDSDGDGVDDAQDVCGGTPPDTVVDAAGDPIGDFDQSCDVALVDYFFLSEQITGPLSPAPDLTDLTADTDGDGAHDRFDLCDNTPAGIFVDFFGRPYGDLDVDCDVDLVDVRFFMDQFTGDFSSCPEGAQCDDGVDCTVGDVCRLGACSGTPSQALCDDGLFCNGAESCNPTSGCVAAAPVNCASLNNACRIGVCDESANGCVAVPRNQGQPCSDGLFCTVGETCNNGTCGGASPRDCSGLSGPCAAGVCNETSNVCVTQPINEGGSCDDGLYCTVGEHCDEGACTGAAPLDCSSLTDACNTGACSEAAGDCVATPRANGTGCNDGSPCTIGDSCNAGACTGFTLPDRTTCDDGDPGSERSVCVSGGCAESTFYQCSQSISYSCPFSGQSINFSTLEFADDGETLGIFNAPAVMIGQGGIGPSDPFVASGSATSGSCIHTYTLQGQFQGDGTWIANFQANYGSGCGPCGIVTWYNIRGTPQ